MYPARAARRRGGQQPGAAGYAGPAARYHAAIADNHPGAGARRHVASARRIGEPVAALPCRQAVTLSSFSLYPAGKTRRTALYQRRPTKQRDPPMTDHLSLLADLIAHARKAGADAADAVLVAGTSLSVQRRLGKTEYVERAEGQD